MRHAAAKLLLLTMIAVVVMLSVATIRLTRSLSSTNAELPVSTVDIGVPVTLTR